MKKSDDISTPLLTKRITAGAKLWMLGAGFKPVEDEVYVTDGWIADLAGIITPTPSEFKRNLKLHKLIGINDCSDPFSSFQQKYNMQMTALVEVKATKADYMKDADRKFGIRDGRDYSHWQRMPAHLCYIAYPDGMVNENELPGGWGKLKFSRNGNKLLKSYSPATIYPQNPVDIIDVVSNIGVRCYNKWTYRELRDTIKRYNSEEKQRNNIYKTNSFLDAVLTILESNKRSLSEELKYRGIKLNKSHIKTCDAIESKIKERL